MTNKKEYNKWKELFLKEQKGISPEEKMYQPVSGISILPYPDDKGITGPSYITKKDESISHSFVVDDSSLRWISGFAERLNSYHIKYIYGVNNLLLNRKGLNSLNSIDSERYYNSLPVDDSAIIMDLRSKANITKIKEEITKSHKESLQFHVIPGDDFLWNVAWIRGVRKYFKDSENDNFHSPLLSIYVPLSESSHAENESQLIPLSNRILSIMVCGVGQLIWDLRKASDWQKRNLLSLLNVPEIIAREGKIFTAEDPIQGSRFFEELSEKIYIHLQE